VDAAPDQYARRLALLGQVGEQPAEERRTPRPTQRVRPGEQPEPAAVRRDLRGENPFGYEKWRASQIEYPADHSAVRTDRVNRHFGLAVPDQAGNGFHRCGRIPRLRRLPVDRAAGRGSVGSSPSL